MTHVLCYQCSVVASVKCYQKLEAYDGQENQFSDEKGIAESNSVRYRESSKIDKTIILAEFVVLTGYHCKHGLHLLKEPCETESKTVQYRCVRSRRVYDEAVKEILTVMWEASDRICGKRLKAIIQELLAAMERYGHLSLDPEVRKRVLRVSAATIDRLLKPIRDRAKSPGAQIRCLESDPGW